MPDLKIEIGADVGGAVKGIDSVTNSLGKAAIAGAKLDSTLGGSVKGINQAGQALTNLGRVAQDAPFGFIGIQNNLNPLLESFQRLRSEAGSNIGALKALGSSLIGAGGLGLALSVVSSGILLYQKYFSDATDTTEKGAESIKLITNSYDDFAAELEKVTGSLGAESAKVSILFSALSDSNIGLRERKGILEQLNQISPGYLGQLDKEKAAYEDIAKAVFAYTDSLAKSAEIKGLLPQVDKLFQGLINAQVQLNQLRRFQGKDKNDPGFFGLSPEDFKDQESALLNTIKNFTNQIKQAKAGLTNFAGGELSLSEILFGKAPELSKAKSEVETIQDVLEKLDRQIHELNVEELTFGIDKSKEKISSIEGAIKQLVTKFKVAPEDTIIQKLFGDIKNLQPLLDHVFGKAIHIKTAAEILIDKKQAEKDLNAQLGKVDIKPIKIPIEVTEDPFLEARKKALAFIDFATGDFSKLAIDSFALLGESIGAALAGADDPIGSFFGGIASLLAQSLKDLGKYVIETSTIIAALKKSLNAAFAGNPTLGIIAGVALIAIGSALEKAIPKFASGVTNFGGGLALVGERGPELVRLPRGSDVIPNHLIGGVGEASTNVFIPDIRVRGNDLLVVFNRASQTSGRNG